MCQQFTIKTHFKKSKQVCVNNLPSKQVCVNTLPSKHTLKSQNKYVSTIYHQNTL